MAERVSLKEMIERVREAIRRQHLLQKNDLVLVGVSGGPDSVALLYVLHSLSKEFGIKLHIGHLDHMLRKDSSKDRAFVEGFARKLRIPITSSQLDIRQSPGSGSQEEIARNARLAFFSQVAKQIMATKIALGHNLDDQAETVLMRILRGTGLYGLAGIWPKRSIDGLIIIRPLLEIPRKKIEQFLRRRGINPRIDRSNFQDIYFRNKIRLSLLPLLEKRYNKNIKSLLANLAQSVGSDYDYLSASSQKLMRNYRRKVPLEKFLRLHPALQRMILRLLIIRLKGDTRRISFRHIAEIEDLLYNRPAGSIVDLPAGLAAKKTAKSLELYRRPSCK